MSHPLSRPFRACLLALMALVATVSAAVAADPAIRFFQIGTGPTDETRFPIGGLIANGISNPPGSRPCEKGGSCGVPGLVAVAKSTNGSMANVEAIGARRLDAALVQADIAYWAYHGSGIFRKKGAVPNLRAIAMLYGESLHLVARADAGIKSVRDLKGKRVSLGAPDSGAQLHGKMLLQAFGLSEQQLKLSPLKPGPAADALAANKLDAALMVDSAPIPAIVELARTTPLVIIPLAGPEIDRLRAEQPFLMEDTIPVGAYAGIDTPVRTLSVGVMLVTGAEQPDDLIYGITRALWHPVTQRVLAEGHPRGKLLRLEAEKLERLGIQLHGGASGYYFDAGLRP